MGERSGNIVFINSHDYVSEVTGTEVVGCLASLTTDNGTAVDVYTQSQRLQHTLEMAYSSGRKVTVDFAETRLVPTERRRPTAESEDGGTGGRFEGPFRLLAIWTIE